MGRGDPRVGPQAKGSAAGCLPISSVAPFQGPRLPVAL